MEEKYQVDHLLLLVGGNSLPNVVAGKLLVAPEGAITLIHTQETLKVAQRLKTWLGNQGVSILFQEVDESDPTAIFQNVYKQLDNQKPHSIGLNYTGGTKAMSVHAYRAIEQWASKNRARPVFSYLDARKLQMVFDLVQDEQSVTRYVGRAMELKLADLLELHGWTLKQDPVTEPILPKSAVSLLNIHAQKYTSGIWGEWLQTELFPITWRREPVQVNCARSPDGQPCVIKKPIRRWLSRGKLKQIELPWPSALDLQELIGVMKGELGAENALNPGHAAKICGYKEPEDFCKWLDGLWLESALLQILHNCSSTCSLHSVSMNLEPKSGGDNPTGFEFDVVAIRGYQLFAFSCSTDTDRVRGGTDRLKKKLFEATIRAHQLGGDEACVALVCCSDDPDRLQDEARYVFSERRADQVASGKERIKVFGRWHLADLPTHIGQWIRSQCGEE